MNDVKTMLGELAQEPQPASTIDVGRAVQDGRRRRRTRLFLECGAVVAAVGLVLGGVSLLGAQRPRPVTVTAPTRFDPMTRYAELGWLPPRLGERSVWIQPEHLVLEAAVPGAEPTIRPVARVAVVLYPAGKRPGANVVEDLPWPLEGGCRTDDGATAPAIGGHPARWAYPRADGNARCDPSAVELRWQYAPGAWAVARTARLTPGDGDPRSVLRRVAESLRVGVNEPLRAPFRAGFVPHGLRPAASVELGTSDSKGWSLSVHLQAREPGPQDRRSVVITVMPTGAHPPTGGSEPLDTTVDGHRAYRRTVRSGLGTSEILRVVGVHGLEFRIATSGAGHDAPEQILHGLTALGTDRAAWTSLPFG